MTPNEAVALSPRAQAEASKRDAITAAFEADQARHAAEREQHRAAHASSVQGLVAVRFLTSYFDRVSACGYGPDEVAGFPPAMADGLCRAGIASRDLKPAKLEAEQAARPLSPAALVTIRILKIIPPYGPGDVIGLDQRAAAALIKQGIAEPAEPHGRVRRMLDTVQRLGVRAV